MAVNEVFAKEPDISGYTKIRDTSDDRDERDVITSDESTIYRDDDIYVTAIFC